MKKIKALFAIFFFLGITISVYSQKALIAIHAEPAADIYISGKKVGNLNYTERIDAGQYTIEIRKEKYITQTKKIVIESGEEYPLNFILDPMTGSLSILTTPPEVQIYLNNELKGISPLIIKDLNIGEYRLRLDKQGFRPYEQMINITLGKSTSVDVSMPEGEQIKILAWQDGVEVNVDRESKGIAPVELFLKKGIHALKLSKSGFQDKDTLLTIAKDQNFYFTLSMQKLTLDLSTNPQGAKVNLNQIDVGITPIHSELYPGTYPVVISKKGFKTIDQRVQLSKSTRLNFDLEQVIVEKTNSRKKGPAIVYSLLFPGAGESYLMRKTSPILLGFAAYGALAGSVVMSGSAAKNYDSYLTEADPDKRASLKSSWKSQHQLSNTLGIAAAGIWVVNMVWTLLTPDDSQRPENISLKGYSNPATGDSGVSLAYRF